jgi:hypothetical protein
MRGISPSVQDAWLRGKPRPIPAVKLFSPYKPTIFAKPEPTVIPLGASGEVYRTGIDRVGPPAPTIRGITQTVAFRRGVTVSDILGQSRVKRISKARHEAYAEVYNWLAPSLFTMKNFFGRDHTSIFYGIRRHLGLSKHGNLPPPSKCSASRLIKWAQRQNIHNNAIYNRNRLAAGSRTSTCSLDQERGDGAVINQQPDSPPLGAA